MDRAALDVALKHRIECGGWVPAGRLDESGRIPEHYPVTELEHGGFAQRTLQNIKDSDGTVIIYSGTPDAGTQQTIQFCGAQESPHLLLDAADISVERAADMVAEFVRQHKIATLNVAGPRKSEWRGGYDHAFHVIDRFLSSSGNPL